MVGGLARKPTAALVHSCSCLRACAAQLRRDCGEYACMGGGRQGDSGGPLMLACSCCSGCGKRKRSTAALQVAGHASTHLLITAQPACSALLCVVHRAASAAAAADPSATRCSAVMDACAASSPRSDVAGVPIDRLPAQLALDPMHAHYAAAAERHPAPALPAATVFRALRRRWWR